jgi:chromate reductase
MTHLIGISGSLRSGSYNTALLRAAFEDLPKGVTAEMAALNDLPMYDWDTERGEGFPAPVADLRARVAAADGIVFATPEYNFSVSGALKNTIDWLSRGPSSPIDFKPAAIVGTGGGGGTRRSQQHPREILLHNSLRVLAEPQVLVPGARTRFADGELADDAVRVELGVMIDGLVGLIDREADATRPEVLGSILLAAPDATAAEEMARQAAERGYRAMSCTVVADAERILSNRSIAAVVIDGGLDPADSAAVIEAASEHHPQAPVIVASDRVGLGEILDDTFGYQPADR